MTVRLSITNALGNISILTLADINFGLELIGAQPQASAQQLPLLADTPFELAEVSQAQTTETWNSGLSPLEYMLPRFEDTVIKFPYGSPPQLRPDRRLPIPNLPPPMSYGQTTSYPAQATPTSTPHGSGPMLGGPVLPAISELHRHHDPSAHPQFRPLYAGHPGYPRMHQGPQRANGLPPQALKRQAP
jgi:hypothetical protein